MTRSTKIRQLLQVVRKTRRRSGEGHRGSEWDTTVESGARNYHAADRALVRAL